MRQIHLNADEARAIQDLSRLLARDYGSSDSVGLMRDLPQHTQAMPPRVMQEIGYHMSQRRSDLALVHGNLVTEADLGRTPESWKEPDSVEASLEYEMATVLYGSLLGSVFGWATQQQGHLVNDLVPVASLADSQVGASSRVELAWHTEDAFHPGRADFICLFCLRNPELVPTTVASLTDILAGEPPARELFQACVQIGADDAQAAGAIEANKSSWDGATAQAVAILTATDAGTEMCIDPAYMSVCVAEPEVHDAVARFCKLVDECLLDVVLRPGDLLILNNRRAVHGRRPFKPSYSGRDRWLKRINVAARFESRLDYCCDLDRRLLA